MNYLKISRTYKIKYILLIKLFIYVTKITSPFENLIVCNIILYINIFYIFPGNSLLNLHYIYYYQNK